MCEKTVVNWNVRESEQEIDLLGDIGVFDLNISETEERLVNSGNDDDVNETLRAEEGDEGEEMGDSPLHVGLQSSPGELVG